MNYLHSILYPFELYVKLFYSFELFVL